MDGIAGWRATSRRVQGPGFELVGLEADAAVATGVWLPETSPLRGEGLGVLEVGRAFLTRPGVPGLARLLHLDREAAVAVYATGELWSVAEVGSALRRKGMRPGMRAGVELAWRVADLLAKAERDAADVGLRGHGGLDPWRIGLRRDGQVVLLGYGLALGRGVLKLTGAERVEALRYAPPERLSSTAEDATSDRFSTALVALEWVLGEPVYRGSADVVEQAAREAEGDHRLYAARDEIPTEVLDVFGRALRRDRDARWADAITWRDALRRALSHPALDGPSLHQLMTSAPLDLPRRFVSLAEIRGDADRSPTDDAAPVSTTRPRWVSLGGRRGSAAKQAAAQAPAPILPVHSDAPALVEAEDIAIPEVATAAPLAAEAPPPADDRFDDEEDATSPTEEVPASIAETVLHEAPASDRRLPLRDPPSRRPVAEDAETAITRLEVRSTDLLRLDIDIPSSSRGRVVWIGDGRAAAAEVAVALVTEHRLPTHDLSGRLTTGWELASQTGRLPDELPLRDLARDTLLSLQRVTGDEVPVEVSRDGFVLLRTAIHPALRVEEVVASLAHLLGAGPRVRLFIDGRAIPPRALLASYLRPGAVVELLA